MNLEGFTAIYFENKINQSRFYIEPFATKEKFVISLSVLLDPPSITKVPTHKRSGAIVVDVQFVQHESNLW